MSGVITYWTQDWHSATNFSSDFFVTCSWTLESARETLMRVSAVMAAIMSAVDTAGSKFKRMGFQHAVQQ